MELIKLKDTDKYVTFGRTITDQEGTALFWTGSGVEFNILSKNLYVNIECGYDNIEIMLDIILDGERTQKLVLDKGLKRYQVFSGMYGEKPVNVRIIRDTQNMPEETNSFLIIKSFETDGNLVDPPVYTSNIEFIGDSLTSGEGCGLTKRIEWIPVIFDAVESYTYKTAKLLNARYSVLSQSGWGLYASWDNNLKNVLPDYYEDICGTSSCKKCIELGAHDAWDFSSNEMDTVVINLGTNDMNAIKTENVNKEEFIEGFKTKAVEFLKNVRINNEACNIVWAYGMLGDEMEPYIKEAIEDYKRQTGDSRVEYLKLPECKGEDVGVRFHPTPAAHEKVAKYLAEHLQSYQAFMLR
ncbi:MAG: hypothetical protein J5718_06585 [Lachnospiraceae bacterium]|nr:hypothetical protein [Lachnospiraceae bacterium]